MWSKCVHLSVTMCTRQVSAYDTPFKCAGVDTTCMWQVSAYDRYTFQVTVCRGYDKNLIV